jgi:AraC-like DNA-binding protein
MYITAGKGTHYIDFEPHALSPGSLIFISKGQVNAFDVQPDIKGYVVLCTTDYLEKNLIHSDVLSLYRLYNYHLHSPVLQPEETRGEGVHDVFKELVREYENPDIFAKEEILRLLFKVLLLKVERIKRTVTADQKKTEWLIRFGQFKDLIEQHIATTRNVQDFAGKLKMSPKHLNTICKAVSGTTAKQFIDNCMVLEIKRILATSEGPMQKISDDFGFDEPTNFVKYFKKHTGQSPSQFRKTFIR